MDMYGIVLILSGLVICLCANRFGRLALGLLAALNIGKNKQKYISSGFRIGIVLFGVFCIFVGAYALISGTRLV